VDAGGGVTVRGWAPARSSAVVFTKTMTSSPRHGTSLATGDLAEEVAVLKRAPGKDLAVYGGSSFVSALIEWGLLDEYHLFVNPVALGRGDPIFARAAAIRQLELVRAVPLPERHRAAHLPTPLSPSRAGPSPSAGHP
jgi:dihydrofolate reductase